MILVSGRACRLESSEIVDHLLKIKVEIFCLNTIEQLFLFVEQLDLLQVYLPYSRLITGIPILVVF